MDTTQQSVIHSKGLNQKELYVFLSIAVVGIFFGIFFMAYYTLISYNFLLFILALISFFIGAGVGLYVEKKTKEQERNK